jgi:hypothetical protein
MTDTRAADCPLCEILGGEQDDPWGDGNHSTHDALMAHATTAERESLKGAAAEHRKSEIAVGDAVTAHQELHCAIDKQLVQPLADRRIAAERERRLGGRKARLLQLLGQEGPGITLITNELEARLAAARTAADEAESDWRILHDYGVGIGAIADEPPF